MKISKTISVRHLKRGTPEEKLAPGQALRVTKPSGKTFLVIRESEAPDLASLHTEIIKEIPMPKAMPRTNLAAWHEEDEE